MTSGYDGRADIIVALRAWRSSEIMDFLESPHPQYTRWQPGFSQPDLVPVMLRERHDRSLSRRRSRGFIESLEELVKEDLSQSARTLAAKLNVYVTTIKQALQEDLRCNSKSYRL